jgi:hypothetical protein
MFVYFSHFLHEANVVVLGQIPVLEEIGAIMCRHRLNQVLNNLVWNKRVSEIQFCDIGLQEELVTVARENFQILKKRFTYLAISNLLETLEYLFGCILILCHTDHKPDELFEADSGIL